MEEKASRFTYEEKPKTRDQVSNLKQKQGIVSQYLNVLNSESSFHSAPCLQAALLKTVYLILG